MMTTADKERHGKQASVSENAKEQELLEAQERIRHEVMQNYLPQMISLGALSRADEQIIVDGIENTELQDTEPLIKFLQRNRRDAVALYRDMKEQLDRAANGKPRAISKQSVADWEERFKDNSTDYKEREHFIENELPGYLERAKKTAQKRAKLLSNPLTRTLSSNDVSDIDKFLSEDKFLSLHYTERKDLTSEVHAAILATEGQEKERYAQAKSMLNSAAKRGILSKNKVGMWLERIFKSKASREKIDAFLYGDSSTSLSSLMDRWANVRGEFDNIEGMKKDIGRGGLPRGFRFVNACTFLHWHYSKRLAYVNEAEKRFENVEKVNPMLLAVRRELDSEDWASARHLIQLVEKESLTKDDTDKLRSMKKYLVENQSTDTPQEVVQESPETAQQQLDELLRSLPASLEPLYRGAIRSGKMDCLAALMYNRVWCHENGHLDGQREIELEETSTEDTARRLAEGAENDGVINSDVDTYKKNAVVSYSGTGVNKAQILHANARSFGTLIAKMQTEDSELFRYWTTLIIRGVDYGTHAFIVKHLNHKIKAAARAANAAKPTPKQKKQNAESSYSSAA